MRELFHPCNNGKGVKHIPNRKPKINKSYMRFRTCSICGKEIQSSKKLCSECAEFMQKKRAENL